jgi:two-component system, OmpR family, response regulator MprA
MSEQARPRIAVVDDEAAIRDVLELGLTLEGFDVRTAFDGVAGMALIRDWEPACIVLDVMMPKVNGIDLIPIIRKYSSAPIIMLTARGDVRDRIEALKAGADDYLPKPFDLGELAARLSSALRRPLLKRARNYRYADLEVDLDTRSVRRGERSIWLSTREFDLVAVLIRSPERVFSRVELLDAVWGIDRGVSPNTVETYVSYVRAKIDGRDEARLLHTIRGVGYSIRDEIR